MPRHTDALPTIDTARLTLRGHSLADFGDCAAMWADPEVTHHIGGRPLSAEEVWARLLRYAGLWALLDFGYWVVRERTTGRFVGEVGLADYRRELTPALDGVPEVGWALASWAHGRGFATEAVTAALAWSDAHFAARRDIVGSSAPTRTVCIIAPENVASIRVAEKCGYRPAAPASYKGQPITIYER